MKKKKIISIIIIVALAGLALYFFVFRNKISGGTSELDQQQYDKLYNYLLNNIDPKAVRGWLGDLARDAFNTGDIDNYYKVDGRTTKTGALMAVYARAYAGYADKGYKFSKGPDEVTQEAYNIFDVLKYTEQQNKL